MSLGLLVPLGHALVSWGLGGSDGAAPRIPCPTVSLRAAAHPVARVEAAAHVTAEIPAAAHTIARLSGECC